MMKNMKKKIGVCLLTAVLTCVLGAVPVLAMENGEAGITPDPPDTVQTEPVPSQPDPVTSQPDPGPSHDPESPSSTPASTPEQPEDPITSHPSSSGEDNSQASRSGNTNSYSSRPNTVSSRVVYSDPDPRESYVEYIPPSQNNTNQNNHTTSAQNPVAVAPAESNTELLSSQDWSALLGTTSQPDGFSDSSSALTPIAGIFSQEEDAHGVSIVLIVGIIMLILGAVGIAFFIYSQFIYKRRKAKAESDDNEHMDDHGHYDGYRQTNARKQDTASLPYVPSERDISSFSNPQMKPPNPLKHPQPPSPPKRNRVEVEDIDWDQFFKDNK